MILTIRITDNVEHPIPDMLKILKKTHVTVFVYGNTESEFDRRRSRWNQLQRIRKDHD